jgi:hypothetical protein
MTKQKLLANVSAVISLLLTLLLTAILLRVYFRSEVSYSIIKDFTPLLISVAAAYLAYCFQRRQAFLVSLRDLWKEMVDAKNELVEYTYNAKPDQSSFRKAHRSLSKAIDLVRGVYKNVDETDKQLGLYPFEPLHDMRRSLEMLGFVDVTHEKQLEARNEITRSWNALRYVFLKEFSTPEPPHPITEINAADPRR